MTTTVATPRKRQRTRRPCDFDDCHAVARSRGLCSGHLAQRSRGENLRPLRAKQQVLTSDYRPRTLTPEAQATWDQLDRHLLAGPTPCADDLGFTSNIREVRTASAVLCADCPALDACRTAGKAETWGVWGGVDRSGR